MKNLKGIWDKTWPTTWKNDRKKSSRSITVIQWEKVKFSPEQYTSI